MKDEVFQELMDSVNEMDKIAKGKAKPSRQFEYAEPEVKAIREATGLSQDDFATLVHVSKRTLENWEQGRRRPTGPARALLQLLEAAPKLVMQTLNRQSDKDILANLHRRA